MSTRLAVYSLLLLLASSRTYVVDSFSATTAKTIRRSYTPREISNAQAQAEAHARSIHDNYSMNALLVSVPERPQPAPCTIAPNNSAKLNGTPSGLPKDLPPGCLLRIGPNGGSRNMGFLDGDGMVHCITLPPPGDGAAEYGAPASVPMYSSTYVATKGRKLENAKDGDATFAGTLGAAPQGLPILAALVRNGITFGTLDLQKDTCNTALAVSGGRILALMEQSPPSEIEFTKEGSMRTVESFARLNGAVPEGPINGGSFGAHGRTDPKTGERVHVSYNSNSRPFVRIDTFAQDWKLTSSVGVDVPTPVMVHDCALTENYVVILDFPLTMRPRRFLTNVFPVEYEPDNGARIGLTPRGKSTDETIWFDVESGVVLHAANAYEREDGMVVVHAFKSVPRGVSSFIVEYTPSFLYQWILDPATGKTMNERCLNPNVMVEFPQVEDRLSGYKADATYGLVSTSAGGPSHFKTPKEGVLLDAAVKFALIDDADNGLVAGDVLSRFDLPPGWHLVSEPTIITKTGGDGHYVLLIATYVPSANDDNDDDEKYIKVATDGKSMKSQLLILDGDCMSHGPVTTVDLPYHVNYGLHSMFVEWDKMKNC